jgi:Uma2 family endonuclease
MAMDDGSLSELIDGRIFMMAPPSTRHQRISSRLHFQLFGFLMDKIEEAEPSADEVAAFEEYRAAKIQNA